MSTQGADARSDDTSGERQARSGVSADDVISSIEMILGRTPDQALVEYHLGLGFADRVALGRYMLSTDEFRHRFDRLTHKGADADMWMQRAAAAHKRKDQFLAFGPPARGLLVDTEHGPFTVDPEDSSVSTCLLQQGRYAQDELELARSFITPESNVLVVGTHIGAFAVPLSRMCARLDAIEANPATQSLLQNNLLLNRCSNVELHCVAAIDGPGTLSFLMNTDNSGGSKRLPAQQQPYYYYDDPQQVEVPAVALDELLSRRAYDLILMDIEGSEYFALKGMQDILARAGALSIGFLPHHIVEVAGIGIEDLANQVEPHFSYMFAPSRNGLYGPGAVRRGLIEMFERGEQHDGLYFLKQLSDEWLHQRGLHRPD